ncbi:glutamate/tyrosine decarboxylase-like PLP-dependent enzyme [Agromyces flavus]|uniref:Glutamate or tyrosine decarboxylase n=1 Tax=Agromyces flavus TaxID=589382 RepID=A0A1H1SXN5_9MICO|nr:pyridoxal-dependent decarboxylase [Agromyces flavus]MCP2369275.1 glutamate/tyrosine decarboxylase-like PLP-dependent enzyme [Agromyces flavus]GGI48751.1 aspartate aminotransferase family protein [Agromyces flavus]SDS52742.1 Glutamate or tyrosine decarboxylase [Agromyces flavus]
MLERSDEAEPAPSLRPHDPGLLDLARRHADAWLAALPERPIPPRATIDEMLDALGRDLPERGEPADAVIERLTERIEPGLMAMGSPRFYGWVIGGTQPVALAADWLVSTWDQNTVLRSVTPGVIAAEEIAGDWVLDLLGLPAGSSVGFTTGATTAQTASLAAAREEVLRRAGWDSARQGLAGGPRVRFIVGEERHGTVDLAGRYLGLGEPTIVPSDDQGRIRVDALRAELAAGEGPAIVLLQAGNIHSGAFDDLGSATQVAHESGAWVHVDGAFGLWAAASPRLRHLATGLEQADSWSTDAHKTLSVPYDCGIAIVRDVNAVAGALSMHASYLQADGVVADPHDKVLELSRRARGVPTWAVLRHLGRQGVADLIERLADAARLIAEGVGALPGVEVLNDVVFTQVCLALEDDAATEALSARLWADGEVLAMTSRWHDRAVVRFSVSNWGTDAAQARRTVAAVDRALAAVRAGGA